MKRAPELRAAPGASLKRELGLPTATALVVGNMIGSGISSVPRHLGGTSENARPDDTRGGVAERRFGGDEGRDNGAQRDDRPRGHSEHERG